MLLLFFLLPDRSIDRFYRSFLAGRFAGGSFRRFLTGRPAAGLLDHHPDVDLPDEKNYPVQFGPTQVIARYFLYGGGHRLSAGTRGHSQPAAWFLCSSSVDFKKVGTARARPASGYLPTRADVDQVLHLQQKENSAFQRSVLQPPTPPTDRKSSFFLQFSIRLLHARRT